MKMNHADIVALLGPQDLAREMEVKEATVRAWKQRNNIPSRHWPGIMEVALKQGKYVSPEILMIPMQDRRAA